MDVQPFLQRSGRCGSLSEEAMNQKVSSLSFVDLPNQKDWNEDLMKDGDIKIYK